MPDMTTRRKNDSSIIVSFGRRVLQAVRGNGLILPGSRVVVAVSGGPDSMGLLDCLAGLAERRDCRWQLHVAHLNHGLRGGAARLDARLVQKTAEARGMACHVSAVDVPTVARSRGIGREEAARDCRYAFLAEVAGRLDANVVAVGHHADDQIETVLHHLIRGTGLAGLRGMPKSRPIAPGSAIRIVRPMLTLRRRDVREYVAAAKVPFRRDRTNRDPGYARNRIRHRLMPLLEQEFNPKFGEAMLRLAALAEGALALIEAQAVAALGKGTGGDVSNKAGRLLTLSLRAVAAAAPIVQGEIIRAALDRLSVGRAEIGYERLSAIVNMLAGRHGGRRIELPGGAVVSRRGDSVIIERRAT